MKKKDLIKQVASETNLTQKDAAKAIEAIEATIIAELAKGESVELIGFGKFEVRSHAARKGRNPQTGETIQIPASKVPAFKAGKALKESVK